jgi:hypothetical protein
MWTSYAFINDRFRPPPFIDIAALIQGAFYVESAPPQVEFQND